MKSPKEGTGKRSAIGRKRWAIAEGYIPDASSGAAPAMTGSFGFEASHDDVSVQCGERLLLPEVRRADPGTLLLADGFSCREQILQATGRTPLRLAQALQRALQMARGETR